LDVYISSLKIPNHSFLYVSPSYDTFGTKFTTQLYPVKYPEIKLSQLADSVSSMKSSSGPVLEPQNNSAVTSSITTWEFNMVNSVIYSGIFKQLD